jgi:hypothetical protein
VSGLSDDQSSHNYLPSAEVLAVVPIDQVPEVAPPPLRGLIVGLSDNGRIVDWKLSTSASLQPGVINEYWAWRRQWTATWPMGPTSNLLALIEMARRVGHAIGADLLSVLDRMCTADYEDVSFDPAELGDLVPQLQDLQDALTRVEVGAQGLVMIDDTPGRQPRPLRRWVTNVHEIVLAANSQAGVILRHDDGIVVVHGEEMSAEFGRVVHVDLTGDEVVVVNATGDRLQLAPSHARPLAWLAPNSLRWNIREIPLVEVWTPLFDGLPPAVATALRDGQLVRLISAFTIQ